jgi:hypothetical protein
LRWTHWKKRNEEKEALAVQGQPKERMCPQCFEINPVGATFCQLCGAGLTTGKDPGGEGSDTEVYRELAQTNLFRMRGAYKDAIQSCLGILKKYPNNATAHTLLGDIHAEMGELQQAAEWYEMALDLSPNSDGDKKKLASVKSRILDKEKVQTAEQIGLDTHRRPMTGVYVGALVVITVLVGGGAFALGSMMTGSKEKPPISRGVAIPSTPNGGGGSTTDQGTGGAGANQTPAPTDDPSPPPGPVAAGAAPSGPDRTALEFLRAQGRSSSRALNLAQDPRTGLVMVTVELDSDLGPQAQAALVAVDVLNVIPNASTASVKIVQGAQTVLVADVSKAVWEGVRSRLTEGQTAGDLAGDLLANVWPASTASGP